jgi:hypothetical protein
MERIFEHCNGIVKHSVCGFKSLRVQEFKSSRVQGFKILAAAREIKTKIYIKIIRADGADTIVSFGRRVAPQNLSKSISKSFKIVVAPTAVSEILAPSAQRFCVRFC